MIFIDQIKCCRIKGKLEGKWSLVPNVRNLGTTWDDDDDDGE